VVTRRDFDVLAEYLGKGKVQMARPSRAFEEAIVCVADACKYINGHFDRERFYKAIDRYYERGLNRSDTKGHYDDGVAKR
jgi:hypothetical protein